MHSTTKNALKNNEKPDFYSLRRCRSRIIRIFYYHQLDAKKLKINLFKLYRFSASCNQIVDVASLGIRQSPRGLRLTLPTLGPSGKQLRLNC